MAQSFEFAMKPALLVGLEQHQGCVVPVHFGVISRAKDSAEATVVLQLITALFDLVGANDHGNAIAIAKLLCARFAE